MYRFRIIATASVALAVLFMVGASSALAEEDVTPPTFGEDTTTPESTTGGQVTFSVIVTDDVGVHNVSVEFGDYGTYYYNWTEMEGDGDTYTLDLTVPDYVVGSLSYRFHAWDVSGNNNTTEVRGVIIEDDDPPTATIVSTLPPTVDTGGIYEVIVNANDNVGVWSVTLHMEMEGVDDEPLLLPVPLQGGGQAWSATVHMPTERSGRITHHILVADLYGNELDLPEGVSDLMDTIPPDMETLIPITTKVGEEVSIVVTATDNIGVAEVRWKGLPFEPDGIYANGT
ncbi:MAG: hypothetical protein GWN39_16485, partial [Thermoplasmata archaeon]|nr:hypothetical protein [Thermoplasmata archaeon]NIT79100.1 hypothetical protein [Thermoplasmata archaeon]NIU50573.1 hypothetical protein [Thermoplasmata archaeon]NIV80295.1 hypothetical protein [Thermoplasmata archaeon]NIY05468.1 hypothetical protein [Thermoplasmata archaeon]